MREIKFRAWHLLGSADMKSPGMIYDDLPGDCLHWKNQGQKITDVMQFTGLKDKNGKEIYEGDIIERRDYCNQIVRQKVFWNKYKWDGIWNYNTSEVIGNIYENPELLKKVSQ